MSAPGDLTRHGREIGAVFDLLGVNENDLTAALGFTLSRSPSLLKALLEEVLSVADSPNVTVRMEHRDHQGRTDLEVQTPTDLLVIEAKRGWRLPTQSQLRLYSKRIRAHGHGKLITLSECSSRWAELRLPAEIDQVAIRHLPWVLLMNHIRGSRDAARGVERVWLTELDRYLRKAIKMTDFNDMWTYCVVLNDERPGGGGNFTFKEYVVQAHAYFYPFGWGSGWPKEPPNFFAYRWAGKVQRVHRVIGFEIVENLQARWPEIPIDDFTTRPHVINDLGPALRFEPIPSGKQYRASRVWVLLDQLFSAASLAAAHEGSEALRRR